MGRADFLYQSFLKHFSNEPTVCQDRLFRTVADFAVSDEHDILVVNGYAGTGKTTAISSVINAFSELKVPTVLLAPTGRAAKVLSGFSGKKAYTVHKHIYRQKSVGDDGFGQFSLMPNKSKEALFVVDEVSLIGIEDPARSGTMAFGTGNLLSDLIQFVRNGDNCRLIMIGDCAQLPPVGLEESPALSPGHMELYGGVRFETLTTVVRQASVSGILQNATMLRNLIAESGPYSFVDNLQFDLRDCTDIERVSGAELIETLSDAYSRYGEDETIVLCRSNRRANRYNAGIRAQVLFRDEELIRGERLMIVRNCYQFVDDAEGLDYIANGDIAVLESVRDHEERYGLHFANARLSFPDYDDVTVNAKICTDTLGSESASLSYEQQNQLFLGVSADYADCRSKRKRYSMVREDPYYNALQIKYAEAITGHKSQGGQWKCVFIDNPFWQDELTTDDMKWMYTALTRAVEKVYLVNFKDRFFL